MYPIVLNLHGKRCLVVGGGDVALRKVQSLRSSGAQVSVVAPVAIEELRLMASSGEIVLFLRNYGESDLDGAVLVIAATDDRKVNSAVSSDARRRGMLVNVVDSPGECDFYVPSVVVRGDLVLAISTGGKSPALARKIREDLEREYGTEYERFLTLMGVVRRKVLAEGAGADQNRQKFELLVRSGLLDAVRRDDAEEIDRILQRTLGPDYALNKLGESSE
ncbi:MAG: bifunctional precorrin-2 dehydrogenase/sirohydrochlorin ferrochelatase [Deltaproteobacteria bacterium]|nr:bifunctional precorrin-2 dehydrogenase/sirohydrochlorin ferrochelatase [Deltaproteobacteria bacterium]